MPKIDWPNFTKFLAQTMLTYIYITQVTVCHAQNTAINTPQGLISSSISLSGNQYSRDFGDAIQINNT